MANAPWAYLEVSTGASSSGDDEDDPSHPSAPYDLQKPRIFEKVASGGEDMGLKAWRDGVSAGGAAIRRWVKSA